MTIKTIQNWAIDPGVLQSLLEKEEDYTAIADHLNKSEGNSKKKGFVEVSGPLLRSDSIFTKIFGASSYEAISHEIDQILENDSNDPILFKFDSPGGEVQGCQALAAKIAGIERPTIAYVDGHCCSAAYWLASACDQISATPTSIIGSLGVMSMVPKSKDDDVISFVSSQSPHKNENPETDSGKSSVQKQVDDLCHVFFSDIAKYRKTSLEEVSKSYGKGKTFVGKEAEKAGMVDIVSEYLDKNEKVFTHYQTPGEAALDERNRISEILEITQNIELANQFIKSGITPEVAALKILKGMRENHSTSYANLIREDKEADREFEGLSLDSHERSNNDSELDPMQIVEFARNYGV